MYVLGRVPQARLRLEVLKVGRRSSESTREGGLHPYFVIYCPQVLFLKIRFNGQLTPTSPVLPGLTPTSPVLHVLAACPCPPACQVKHHFDPAGCTAALHSA